MDPGALTEAEKNTALSLHFDLRVVEHLKRVVKRPLRSYRDLYNCDEEGRDPRRYMMRLLAHSGLVSEETRRKALRLQIEGITSVTSRSPTAKKVLTEIAAEYKKELATLPVLTDKEKESWFKYQQRGLLFDVDNWKDELRSSVCPPGYIVEKLDGFSVQKNFATRDDAEKYRQFWPWKQARIYDFSQRPDVMNHTVPLGRLTDLHWEGDEEVLANGDNTFNVHRQKPFRVLAMIQVMIFRRI